MALLRFGEFELDVNGGQLRKGGVQVKLPPQPLQALQLLAENAGELLTREKLQKEIWSDGTFVDFDRNLNVCMAQIRAALNDDPDAPRFIQTVPRRGYRFLPHVDRVMAGAFPIRWIWLAAIAAAGAVLAVYVARHGTGPQAPAARVMLAALPFENLSGGPEADEFIDGLAEELMSQFGSLAPARLGVIARTSVMRFRRTHPGIREVGHDLGVDYVVEGTARRNGGRVRVTARLIKVMDQAQVWTSAYELEGAEAFRLEQEAAAHIAAGVAGALFQDHVRRQGRFHAVNRDSYEAYRSGRYLQDKGTRADLERSIAKFDNAAKLDPAYAEAYAAMADSYVALARSGSAAAETFPQAAAAARRAIELDSAAVEAHNALANDLFWYEWKWSEAEQHFRRALEINPSYAPAHHDYAWLLVALGRTEEGLTSLQRAIALDPLSARINIDSGWLLLQAHRFEEAIRQARRALDLEPGLAEAQACIKRAQLAQKNALGNADKSKMLDELERAFESHSLMLPLLETEPAYASLHGNPRFEALARKIGLR